MKVSRKKGSTIYPPQIPMDHKPAHRTCLGAGCGKTFWSLGPACRVCDQCQAKWAGLSRRESEGK